MGKRIEIDGPKGTTDEFRAGWVYAMDLDDDGRAEVARLQRLGMSFTDAVLDVERKIKLWRSHGS